MGDRGNIVVRQAEDNKNDVWLYTHWSGSEIGEVVANALARKHRWTDPSYLTRIIFDELTKGQQGEETGCGISCEMKDNEHDILVVDCPKQCVYTIPEKSLKEFRIPAGYQPQKAVGFAVYCKVKEEA